MNGFIRRPAEWGRPQDTTADRSRGRAMLPIYVTSTFIHLMIRTPRGVLTWFPKKIEENKIYKFNKKKKKKKVYTQK